MIHDIVWGGGVGGGVGNKENGGKKRSRPEENRVRNDNVSTILSPIFG